MSIISIQRDTNNNVSIVRISADNTIADISQPNYIADQQSIINELNKGPWKWYETDTLLVSANDANGFFAFTDTTFSTVVLIAGSTDGVITPGFANQIPYYPANGNVLAGTSNLPSLVQVHPANWGNGAGANSKTFARGDGSWDAIPSSQFAVYVSPDGDDITGTGFINSPYATIAHALSTITTNNHLNIFNIICSYGIYNEPTLLLKPFVSIDGTGSELNVTGGINLDSSWSSIGINGGITRFINFFSVTTTSNVNLDFSVAGVNSTNLIMENIDFTSVSGSFNLISGRNSLFTLNSLSSISPTFQNLSGTMDNCYLGALTFIADSGLATSNFTITNSNFNGSVNINGNVFALTSIINIYSTKLGFLSADQANVQLFIDCNSLSTISLPTLSNGASATYINIANTLTANYSPVNYTPDATFGTNPSTSVAAHLHGIDNALVGVSVPSTLIYVGNNGSDSTGNGSFDKPYQTISHAMASITTATVTNNFTIVLLDTIFNESAQIMLKQYVNIASYNMNVTINNAMDIVIDPTSWATISPGFSYYNNLFINGNVNVDFASITPTGGPYLQFNNIQVSGTFTFNGGHVNSPNGGGGMAISNSFLYGNVFIDCANSFESQGNLYLGTVNIGTLDASNFCNALCNGDTFQAVNVGTTSMTAFVFYTVTGSSLVSLSLTDVASALRYTSDSSSYVSPTIALGSPSIVLKSISDGVTANYSPSNYTPVATTPTLTTSVQAHLRGIDNALGNKTLIWNDVTGISQAAAVNNGYVADNAALVTITLPATCSFGDRVAVQGKDAGGWSLVANTGQTIHVGNTASSVAGSVSSTNQWDSLELICVTANTTWAKRDIGNFTIA